MQELTIQNSELKALVDDEDFERLSQFKWHTIHSNGVSIRRLYGLSKTRAVSLAAEIMRQPRNMFDHKDQNPLNNSKNNLRLCSYAQNNVNRKKTWKGSSKYKGVSWDKKGNKWASYATFNNRKIHLGFFANEDEAAKAYDAKAKELFGEFAYLNFLLPTIVGQ